MLLVLKTRILLFRTLVLNSVDETKFNVLLEQLVLCNDEIERLQRRERELMAENAELKQKVSTPDQMPSYTPTSVVRSEGVVPPTTIDNNECYVHLPV